MNQKSIDNHFIEVRWIYVSFVLNIKFLYKITNILVQNDHN
jgi:hypothetical protein